MSPWSRSEHAQAFDALRVVYPPKHVKRIFDDADGLPWLAPLLGDPFRPDLSGLLSLGFDAAHARIDRYPALAHRLRFREHYGGARLELAIIAALGRARLKFEYEPLSEESKRRGKKGESYPNPDLELWIGKRVLADIKQMEVSARAQRSTKRFHTILHGPSDVWVPIDAYVELTAAYAQLERSEPSDRVLDRRALELHQLIVKHVPAMKARGAVEETIADGLIRLRTDMRGGSGVALDDPRDAERVVDKLDEGASQIPAGEKGIVIVQPSTSESFPLVRAAAETWLEQAKTEIVGVVLIVDHFVEGARHAWHMFHPLWRSGAPSKLRRPHHWNKLTLGYNWRWLRAMEMWGS